MRKTIYFLLILILVATSFLHAQEWKRPIQENIDSIFQSGRLVGRIINPNKFKIPDRLEERVILLINEHVFSSLPSEVHRFVQDMFDEGIEVIAIIINDKQFKKESGEWEEDAGHRLKYLIIDVYKKFKMGEIHSPRKRGLILLGSFPAEFILWQQENFINTQLGWADIKLTNDFRKGIIQIEWKPFPPGQVVRYKITAYEVPDVSDLQSTRKEIPPQWTRPNPIFVDSNSTKLIFHPPKRGQNNFQFKIEAVLPNNNLSPASWSGIVNWNFLINPSDYVLADIDGLTTRAVNALEYTDNNGDKFGIKATPVLAVTDRVESNIKGFELSSEDKLRGRPYAKAEMYFGRIDAYSLTRAWQLPEIDAQVKQNKLIPDNLLQDREIEFIKAYLDRNHEWRKNKAFRKNYSQVYFFRSSDFVNPIQEKAQIADWWKNKKDISEVLLEDAKLSAGCSNPIKPEAVLYSKPNFSGETVTITEDIPDLSNIFNTTPNIPQSLRIVIKGTGGAVQL